MKQRYIRELVSSCIKQSQQGHSSEGGNDRISGFVYKRILPIFIFTALMISCAPPAVKTTVLAPARFHEASRLKEVTVLPFDGRYGREFAAELEGVLAGVNIADKQYFTIVDRTRLEQVLNEMKFSQSGLVDPDKAANIGKMVGAKGIYSGVITEARSVDHYYTEERSECAEKKDPKKFFSECIRWNKKNVNCTKRTATFSFTPKLIEVETSRVVYANNLSATAAAQGCQDSTTPLKTPAELIEQAKKTALVQLRQDVSPYYMTLQLRLMESTDGTTPEAAKKLEQGMEYARASRLDRACELWGEARIASPNAPSVLYNLGICSEVTGDPQKALELYNSADRAIGRPDDMITAAMGRVRESIQKQKNLKEQMGK